MLGLHLASAHVPRGDMNNVNPGVYCIRPSGATLGLYRNSYRKASIYAGWTWNYGPWRLQAGLITGYHTPFMVAPSVALGHGWRLVVLPKVESGGSTVLHLQYEKHF